jgi:ABC-type transporter Mla subunit MlaD
VRGTYIRVGALVIVAVTILVAAVFFLGGNQIRHGHNYETYFRDSVQGLDVGAPVKYRGVTIGAVTQIALTSAEYGRNMPEAIRPTTFRTVMVRFEVDADRVGQFPTARAVDQGLRAKVAPQGLTGVVYIELDFVDPQKFPALVLSWTPRYDYLPSVPSTLSQVQDAATVLLGKIQQVDINGLADGVLALVTELRSTLKDGDAHALIEQATQTLHAVQVTLKQADVPALSAELRQTLAAARGLAQGPQTKELLRNAAAATERLTQATAQLPQLLAALDAVARRANAGSADLEAGLVPLLRDARTTVAALRETSEALRRDPSQVVLGAPPPRSRDK